MKRNVLLGATIMSVMLLSAGTALAGEIGPNAYTLGLLGVGTSSPAQSVHMFRSDSGSVRFRLQNSEGSVDFFGDNNAIGLIVGGSVRMYVRDTGNVGIGTLNPTTKLDVAGTVKCEILEITGGADLSEMFRVKAAADTKASMVEPGMVVSIDTVKPGELIVSSKGL